jgi:hypothetical protein
MSGNHLGLTIGLPFSGRVTTPWWGLSLATMDWPLGFDVNFCVIEGMEVGEARNRIVEEALRNKTKYLWFIDDDTAPPRHAAKRLVSILQQEESVVACGGIYCTKSDSPEPIVQKQLRDGVFWNWKPGDVFDCEGIGTGCLMVRVEAFEKIEKPWFKTIDCMDIGKGEYKQTDDLYFCAKAKDAGMRIQAHGGVLPLHWQADKRTSYRISETLKEDGKLEMVIFETASYQAKGVYG